MTPDEAGAAGLSAFVAGLVHALDGATRCDRCGELFVDRLARKLCCVMTDGTDGTGWAEIAFLCFKCEGIERVHRPASSVIDYDRVH